MNTQHESFPSRYGSPREDKLTCFGLNRLNKISIMKTTKTQLIGEFHTTGINELKQQPERSLTEAIYIIQPRCLIWNKVHYITKSCYGQQTNIIEGFTNDPNNTPLRKEGSCMTRLHTTLAKGYPT